MGNCSHQEVFICISMYDILIKSQRQLTQKRLLWTNLCGLLVTDRKCAGNGSGNGKIIKWKLVSRYQFSQEWRIKTMQNVGKVIAFIGIFCYNKY